MSFQRINHYDNVESELQRFDQLSRSDRVEQALAVVMQAKQRVMDTNLEDQDALRALIAALDEAERAHEVRNVAQRSLQHTRAMHASDDYRAYIEARQAHEEERTLFDELYEQWESIEPKPRLDGCHDELKVPAHLPLITNKLYACHDGALHDPNPGGRTNALRYYPVEHVYLLRRIGDIAYVMTRMGLRTVECQYLYEA